MMVSYSPQYRKFYNKLSKATGLSNERIDQVFISMVEILTRDIDRDGEIVIPYLGKFYLKRMPPRKRSVSFVGDERLIVDVPAYDKLKFKVNAKFAKRFK